MIEVIFDLVGNFVRWIVIYHCDSKEMNKKYNSNPKSEGLKNTLAGVVLWLLILFIGFSLFQ